MSCVKYEGGWKMADGRWGDENSQRRKGTAQAVDRWKKVARI